MPVLAARVIMIGVCNSVVLIGSRHAAGLLSAARRWSPQRQKQMAIAMVTGRSRRRLGRIALRGQKSERLVESRSNWRPLAMSTVAMPALPGRRINHRLRRWSPRCLARAAHTITGSKDFLFARYLCDPLARPGFATLAVS